VPGDAERRQRVESTITVLRRVWSGVVPPAAGFLRPQPVPPILVAAVGPKMADLAGRASDGICVPVGPTMTELVALARRARADAGRDPGGLVTAALLSSWPEGTEPPLDVDLERLIVYVAPPFVEAIFRLDEMVGRWRTETPHPE
jgi:alkanesulfonate monooxygenase SsuD/methylene tetrahydromethanopterin reductase-like flavin-dependent oxidoreductase (luciferase family)